MKNPHIQDALVRSLCGLNNNYELASKIKEFKGEGHCFYKDFMGETGYFPYL